MVLHLAVSMLDVEWFGVRFLGNASPSTGGGLHLTFVSEDTVKEAIQVTVAGCEFLQNRATFGGGVFFLPLSE